MQMIEIVVAPDGSTRIETKGFAGSCCRQASASIEQALGQRAGERPTDEFYVHESRHESCQEPA